MSTTETAPPPGTVAAEKTKLETLKPAEREAKMQQLFDLADDLWPCAYVIDLPERLDIGMDDPRLAERTARLSARLREDDGFQARISDLVHEEQGEEDEDEDEDEEGASE
jgi:hypothetical protein